MRLEPLEEGRRWLEQARDDLRWAEHLAREGAYNIACFLAQQVGEKALKGFLPSRYPNALAGSIPARVYTREMAAGAVGLAREVVEFVGPRIEA
jgi:HEPN domain-containing protein